MAASVRYQNDQDLLTAAMSAIMCVPLASPTDCSGSMPKVSLFDFHDKTYSYGRVGSASSDPIAQSTETAKNIEGRNEIVIYVKTLFGHTLTYHINQETTVSDLKSIMESKEKIPSIQQRLIFNGKQLENTIKLVDHNIQHESTLHLVLRLQGESPSILDPSSLDPSFDYDFTNIKDANITFMRGGVNYVRPCGWKRFAIKVSNKFENLTWLGASNNPGEWPVSYHGTGVYQDKTFAMNGYDLTKGKMFAFGRGVYSTPNIKVAEKYAIKFLYKNEHYAVILQNRVNPTTLVKISADRIGEGEYWISPSDKDIRPYGVCIRKL
ncbi:uncharacterized protein LOC100200953 [Hydra vulgaris]|uniref:uncharacterized protein LOC100200953 n=1 Tax=Hydra vulgaris TaxID=6087 RepID=UPI0001924D39|nr:uncharacterized protein LOC100200953 [Hydra vulgaris]